MSKQDKILWAVAGLLSLGMFIAFPKLALFIVLLPLMLLSAVVVIGGIIMIGLVLYKMITIKHTDEEVFYD